MNITESTRLLNSSCPECGSRWWNVRVRTDDLIAGQMMTLFLTLQCVVCAQCGWSLSMEEAQAMGDG